MATITTEQECPRKALNNQLLILYRHAIWDTPLLSDISACYRSIGIDSKSQLLRLLLWFKVNEDTGKVDLDKPVVYRRDNIDFGDKPGSVIIEVGLGKLCASACKLVAAAELLCDKMYADDIADSIRSMMKERSDGNKRGPN